jgi:hypothetical protein
MNNPFKEKISVFNPACVKMWKEMAKEKDKKMARDAMSDFERATGIKIEYSEVSCSKEEESKNGDAIIAIDESGHGHMIIMLTRDHTKIALQSEHDDLPELEYLDTLPGIYYADMHLLQTGDDVEVDWEIVKPLYPIFLPNTDTSDKQESK